MALLLFITLFWIEELTSKIEGDTWDKVRSSGISNVLLIRKKTNICYLAPACILCNPHNTMME